MPHIVIQNLTNDDFEEIEKIEEAITKTIVAIPKLGLKKDDISYHFPKDTSVISDDVPVVIIVELLFEKPERTKEVRDQMAKAISEAFRKTAFVYRNIKSVEVAVKRFDPNKDGFCSWRNESEFEIKATLINELLRRVDLDFEPDMTEKDRETLDVERQMLVLRTGWNNMPIDGLRTLLQKG